VEVRRRRRRELWQWSRRRERQIGGVDIGVWGRSRRLERKGELDGEDDTWNSWERFITTTATPPKQRDECSSLNAPCDFNADTG